jgi:hypothetical protein
MLDQRQGPPTPSLPRYTHSPSPTPSHPHSTQQPPRTTAPATQQRQQKQFYLAVPSPPRSAVEEERAGPPSRSGFSLEPPQVPVAQPLVQGLDGARRPSYGALGSRDEPRQVLKDWRRRNQGPNGFQEERLAKRPRIRERRDFAEWMEGIQKRQYPYAEGCASPFFPTTPCPLDAFFSRTDPACSNVGNDVLSCYPETNSTLTQGDYSKLCVALRVSLSLF